jgi:adenylosuccinate synthase
MSSNAFCIIGANYGDEGKGLMTDYLCRKINADVVIRFNGGAQAGHTVVTPEGSRHVFSHFGSGTLNGTQTFLSRFFIVNPIIFNKEYEIIKGFKPSIIIDPRCLVTTPWDMIYNQFLEELRGSERHGSCGLGIGATIERNEIDNESLYLEDLYCDTSYLKLEEIVTRVQNYYLYKISINKFSNLNKSNFELYDKYQKLLTDNNITKHFIDDINLMFERSCINNAINFNTAIFEGAQGLALDQHMGEHPYVTRSNCGMRNIQDLQREMKFDISEIIYVTRTYMTRHGNGPLKEPKFTDFPESINDNTNISNSWQGSIRFADITSLSAFRMAKRIKLDLESNNINIPISIAITHLDQYKSKGLYSLFGLFPFNSFKNLYKSNGPTYKDVKCSEVPKNLI